MPDFDASTAPAIAVVGCGAIARAFHLPSLARHAAVRDRLVLVDPDVDRARSLGKEFGVTSAAASLEEVLPGIDGAVLAVPASLHHPLTLTCVEAGVHVLCEKPLARTGAEVRQIVEAAAQSGVTVGVNHTRRLSGASQLVKEILDSGRLGTPRKLEYLQGERFDWPAASPSYFGAKTGRGVLADLGAHVVDLACWWLEGPPRLESYADDSRGGTEAVAAVAFRIGACEVDVRLSWLTRYANTYAIECERGVIRGEVYDDRTVTVEGTDGRTEKLNAPRTDPARGMIDAFLLATSEGTPQAVAAEDVLPSVELIDECYERRRPLPAPWYPNAAPVEGT